MKHLKSFNEAYKNYSKEEILKNRIIRRISMKSNDDMVERLIVELKKKSKNQGFIDGLMWSLGLSNSNHTWVQGDTLRTSDFKNKK